jgi:hypothetical protein
VLEVRSRDEALRLNDWLCEYPGAVGLDTETIGWSPDDGVSPVGRARIFCVTLAWGKEHTPCFIPQEWFPHLRGWLESPLQQKVGTNLWSFDRHVFANEGIRLDGILGDTVVMSRLLDSRPEIDAEGGHGLKAYAARMGIPTVEFADLVRVERVRLVQGKVRQYKRCGTRNGVLYGGDVQDIGWKRERVQLSIQTVWNEFPERRKQIMGYATLDAALSLRVYESLRRKLEARKW